MKHSERLQPPGTKRLKKFIGRELSPLAKMGTLEKFDDIMASSDKENNPLFSTQYLARQIKAKTIVHSPIVSRKAHTQITVDSHLADLEKSVTSPKAFVSPNHGSHHRGATPKSSFTAYRFGVEKPMTENQSFPKGTPLHQTMTYLSMPSVEGEQLLKRPSKSKSPSSSTRRAKSIRKNSFLSNNSQRSPTSSPSRKSSCAWNPVLKINPRRIKFDPAVQSEFSQLRRELEDNEKKIEKKLSIHSTLAAHSSVKWLKSRHKSTTKSQYVRTREELEQDQEIEDVFTKIDVHQHGYLRSADIMAMFQDYGFDLTKEDIRKFFMVCWGKPKERITMEDFGKLYLNPKAETWYQQIVKKSRALAADEFYEKEVKPRMAGATRPCSQEGGGSLTIDDLIREVPLKEKKYLPLNLCRLLEHMALKNRREIITKRIEEAHYTEALEIAKNFVKLFIIDRAALDSISKDECSKRVNEAITRVITKEEKALKEEYIATNISSTSSSCKKPILEKLKGKLVSIVRQVHERSGSISLKRLDSMQLGELTQKLIDPEASSQKLARRNSQLNNSQTKTLLEGISNESMSISDESKGPLADMEAFQNDKLRLHPRQIAFKRQRTSSVQVDMVGQQRQNLQEIREEAETEDLDDSKLDHQRSGDIEMPLSGTLKKGLTQNEATMATMDLHRISKMGGGFKESLSSSMRSTPREHLEGHSADDMSGMNTSAQKALELRKMKRSNSEQLSSQSCSPIKDLFASKQINESLFGSPTKASSNHGKFLSILQPVLEEQRSRDERPPSSVHPGRRLREPKQVGTPQRAVSSRASSRGQKRPAVAPDHQWNTESKNHPGKRKVKMAIIPKASVKLGSSSMEQAFQITSIGEQISELAGDQELGPSATTRGITSAAATKRKDEVMANPEAAPSRRGPSPQGFQGVRHGKSQLGHYQPQLATVNTYFPHQTKREPAPVSYLTVSGEQLVVPAMKGSQSTRVSPAQKDAMKSGGYPPGRQSIDWIETQMRIKQQLRRKQEMVNALMTRPLCPNIQACRGISPEGLIMERPAQVFKMPKRFVKGPRNQLVGILISQKEINPRFGYPLVMNDSFIPHHPPRSQSCIQSSNASRVVSPAGSDRTINLKKPTAKEQSKLDSKMMKDLINYCQPRGSNGNHLLGQSTIQKIVPKPKLSRKESLAALKKDCLLEERKPRPPGAGGGRAYSQIQAKGTQTTRNSEPADPFAAQAMIFQKRKSVAKGPNKARQANSDMIHIFEQYPAGKTRRKKIRQGNTQLNSTPVAQSHEDQELDFGEGTMNINEEEKVEESAEVLFQEVVPPTTSNPLPGETDELTLLLENSDEPMQLKMVSSATTSKQSKQGDSGGTVVTSKEWTLNNNQF